MKKITFVAIIFFCLSSLYAQNPVWNWARTAESISGSEANTTAYDNDNNIITGGFFSGGQMIFDNITLSNSSNQNQLFISKHNSSGILLWAITAPSQMASVNALTTDTIGNIYVVGQFYNTITFGSTTLTSQEGSSGFIVKLNANGDVLWVQVPQAQNVIIHDITVFGDYFAIIGSYTDNENINFGNNVTLGSANSDIFITKYIIDGTAMWADKIESSGMDFFNSFISFDNQANIYVSGAFLSTSLTFENITFNNKGESDFFVAKYNNNNNQLMWAHTYGGSNFDVANSITIDNFGNCYILASSYSNDLVIGNENLSNLGSYDIIILKLNPDGQVTWTKVIGGNFSDNGTDISHDNNNNIYICGFSYSNSFIIGETSQSVSGIFVFKLNTNGNLMWLKSATAYDGTEIYSLNINKNTGDLAVAGQYSGELILDSEILNSATTNILIATINGNELGIMNSTKYLFNLYPNPAKNTLTINTDILTDSNYSIIDMTGRIVQNGTVSDKSVNVSMLPAGIYIMNIDGQESKFVKE